MQDAIENPASLILPSSIAVGYKYDWLYNSTSNLWSYSSEGLKTIYDPCPFGYKVPDSEIQALFSGATYDSFITGNGATISNGDNTIRIYLLYSTSLGRDVGLYVNQGSTNVFFPFAGFKGVDRGMSSLTCAWKHVGAKGDYMSSSVMSSGHRSRVYLSSATSWTEIGADGTSADYSAGSHYVLDETNRRTAGSIRCVKDDAFASISIELTPDQDSYVVGDYAQVSYQILVNGVKDDLLNKLDISVEYEYEDSMGQPIIDKSVDGSLPSGTLKLSNEKKGQFTLTVREFTSQPKYLKATLVLKNAGVVRASKSVLLLLSNSSWDSYTRYEGKGDSPSGDGIQSGKAIDTVNPFIFTFKNSTSSFLRPHETYPWSLPPVIVNNTDPSSDFLKSCFFYFEDLNNTTAEKSPYKTVAACYFKVIDPKSRAVYYLKRTSYSWGYGISFTTNKSEATLIYICSDWSGNTQDYVDLIDSDGNYLYYNRGQKRLQFDGSYAYNLYQWYIHKGIL